MKTTFSIEEALQNWVNTLRSQRAMNESDILELSHHLQDECNTLMESSSHSAEDAWAIALYRLGDIQELMSQYSLVDQKKVISTKLRYIIIGALLMLLIPNLIKSLVLGAIFIFGLDYASYCIMAVSSLLVIMALRAIMKPEIVIGRLRSIKKIGIATIAICLLARWIDFVLLAGGTYAFLEFKTMAIAIEEFGILSQYIGLLNMVLLFIVILTALLMQRRLKLSHP